MPACADLLDSLSRRGVSLWTEDGQLHFAAPKGLLSTDDLSGLRTHKQRVIELLEQASLREFRIRRRTSCEPLPLTALQLRKWRHAHAKHSGQHVRTCIISQCILGPLDKDALAQSLREVVRRHDALRIGFVLLGDAPRQQAAMDARHELAFVDLESESPANAQDGAMVICRLLASERFDLLAGPLWRAQLFKLSAERHILVVALDHMISDLVSRTIIADEIWLIYDQLARGLPASLPTPSFQFTDYVAWQHRTHNAWLTLHASYWNGRLRDVPHSKLARYDELEPPVSAEHPITFGDTLTAGLRSLARQQRSSLALVLLTIYAAVLARWLDQRDFILAFVSNGRDRPELQKLVGFFADYLHLRVQLADNDRFVDVMGNVSLEFCSACEHQDYGRVPDLMVADPATQSLPECGAEVVFNWMPDTSAEGGGGLARPAASMLEIRPISIPQVLTMPVPMKVAAAFRETTTQVTGSLIYRPDIFETSAIEQLVHTLLSFAEQVVARPDDRLPSTKQPRAAHWVS